MYRLVFEQKIEILFLAARQIVAHEIAVDPKLKLFVRNVYLSDAVITVTPTAKGINELEPHHPYYVRKKRWGRN